MKKINWKKVLKVALPCLLMLGAVGVFAQDPITIPDLGVDVPGYVEAAGTKMGTVLAAVFGVSIMLFLGWMGLRYLKRGVK